MKPSNYIIPKNDAAIEKTIIPTINIMVFTLLFLNNQYKKKTNINGKMLGKMLSNTSV